MQMSIRLPAVPEEFWIYRRGSYPIMTHKSIHVVYRCAAASYYLQKYWDCFLKAYWHFASKNISLRMTKWRYSTNSLFWSYILADVLPFAKSCCGLRTMKENVELCAAAMLGLSGVAFCANLRKRCPLRPIIAELSIRSFWQSPALRNKQLWRKQNTIAPLVCDILKEVWEA